MLKLMSLRDVLFKDLTFQRTYNTVFKGLARWEVVAETLVEQIVDVHLEKDVVMSENDSKSETAILVLSLALQEALETQFNGSARDLAETMAQNLSEHLCEKIKLGTSTAELTNEVEIEMQTPMTVSDALIIIKTRGDVDVLRRERLGNVKVGLDLAMRLIILDHAKLQTLNEDPNLKVVVEKTPDNYVMNQCYSTNALVTGYRAHWHKPAPWSAMKSLLAGPPADHFAEEVEAKRT